MARSLNVGFDDAFTCLQVESEQHWNDVDPQPNRVGFKQTMSGLYVEDTEASRLTIAKKMQTREDSLDELDMTPIGIPSHLRAHTIWHQGTCIHGKAGNSKFNELLKHVLRPLNKS
jgi:hypothetical protein